MGFLDPSEEKVGSVSIPVTVQYPVYKDLGSAVLLKRCKRKSRSGSGSGRLISDGIPPIPRGSFIVLFYSLTGNFISPTERLSANAFQTIIGNSNKELFAWLGENSL